MKFSDVMNMCQGNSQHNTPEWDINDNHIPKVSLVLKFYGFLWVLLSLESLESMRCNSN
jgi:hypothetical protein